ncbi:MAG: hypothetical protein ACRYFS_11350 [Janthinobacterium lividum]
MSEEMTPGDKDPSLPSAVNLPLLAEDVTFDISIKRAARKSELRLSRRSGQI